MSDSVLGAAGQIAQAVSRRLVIPAPAVASASYVARPREVEDAFLRGLADINSNLDHRVPSAVAHLTRAVELDRTFAEGWAQLALAEQRYIELRNPTDRDRLAVGVREKALNALAIDPALPTAHVALGVMQFHHDWDVQAAEDSFRRAIELVPGDAYARTRYAWLLAAQARHEEAIAQADAARALEPRVAARYIPLAMVKYYARDFVGALNDLQRALELSPGFPLAYLCLGRVHLAAGDAASAIDAVDRALSSGRNPGWLWVLAHAQALAGRHEAVQRTLREIEQHEAAGRFASIDNRAYLAIATGRVDEGLPFLEEAIERRMTNVLWLAVDPRADLARSDPRFQALVARMRILN
jgi:Tfp pilus assembly protein PilF